MSLRSRLASLARRSAASLNRAHATKQIDTRILELEQLSKRVEANSAQRATILNDIGNRFRDRYLITGSLADLDTSLGYYRESIALDAEPKIVAVATGNIAAALVDRYNRLGDLADLEAAISASRTATHQSDAGSPERALLLANLTHALHELYYRTRRESDLQEAIEAGEEALRLAPTDSPERAAAMVNLAVALLEQPGEHGVPPHLARAIELLETAVAAWPEGSPEHTRTLSALSMARLLRVRPQLDQSMTPLERLPVDDSRSIAELRRVVANVPAGSPVRHAANHAIGRALWLTYQLDRNPETLKEAIEAFQAAVAATPEDAGELPAYLNDLGIALSELPFVTDSAQGLADAVAAWVRALRVLDASFASVAVAYKLGQQGFSASLGIAERAVSGYLWLAEIMATDAGRGRQLRNAMWTAESSKSRLLTELIGRSQDLPGPPRVPVDRERELLVELGRVDTAALAGHGAGSAAGVEQSDRRARLHQELDAVWATMSAASPQAKEYVALRRGGPLTWETLSSLAERLGPSGVLVSMFMTNQRTMLFLLRSGDDTPVLCETDIDRDGWLDVLRRFEREVSRGTARRGQTWDARLRPLFEAVVPHLEGVERVVLAPQGWGLKLPWSTVAARAGWHRADGGPMPIVTVDALGLLPPLLDRYRPPGTGAMVVGNPTGDLTHAETEARTVAAMLGVPPLLGPEATKERVLSAMRKASIAHIAAHARFTPGAPLDSGVVLADGLLTAREILAESLGLDLLVLSGCETGVAESLGGYEFAGPTQAFLQAGARCLVASLWAVDDPATAALMTTFYEHWRSGSDVARALGDAQTAGAFVLSGDWTVKWPTKE